MALHMYEAAAEERLPGPVWDFFAGGSGTESMLTAGREALDRVQLRPRCLVDVSRGDPGTDLLGTRLAAPLAVAPMAYHQLAHPEGEVATARGAGEAGALLTVSMFASRNLEDIAAAASGPLWLPLYWLRRREVMRDLIRRAKAAGFRALVLTVDAPPGGPGTRPTGSPSRSASARSTSPRRLGPPRTAAERASRPWPGTRGSSSTPPSPGRTWRGCGR